MNSPKEIEILFFFLYYAPNFIITQFHWLREILCYIS